MLEGFLSKAKDNESALDLKELMTADESLQWEILVKAMDSIDIMNVGRDLKKITKSFLDLKKVKEF